MLNVLVASRNPVKIQAIKQAFEKMFPTEELTISGAEIESGVAEQPMSSEETLRGARNRNQTLRQNHPQADYYASIEGGVFADTNDELMVLAWIVITNSAGQESKAQTGTFLLPPVITAQIKNGVEMGVAADNLHGTTNVKQGLGTVGILTDGVINRTDYYVHAAVLALIPFKQGELYKF
ncbi:MAG: inosine/xanthosine triphosphatase [Patescibacteria group bacterium]